MLQRAASNAYSWWWASHIRTKQSKWLEQNLQDMEERVGGMLQIIDDEGDTFAQRAEMYYKKRPELVSIVEETYRAYRALAERYDSLSKDLQSANRTIASVFPEQVPFAIDEEEDEDQTSTSCSPSLHDKSGVGKPSTPKVPFAKKDMRSQSAASSPAKGAAFPSSGLDRNEARDEIDKLQKEILNLQTEMEFVKSSYERGYQKFLEIENQISEKQKRICSLQDEFGIESVIEDDEARTLMASRALKSCQETLVKLKVKHERSTEEARVESRRIRHVNHKFEALRNRFDSQQTNVISTSVLDDMVFEIDSVEKERQDLEIMQKEIEEQLELSSNAFLTMSQFAEKIDDLVQRVINLEIAVFSENALVQRIRADADMLQTQVKSLEEDKEALIEGSDIMKNRMNELEGELSRVKDLVKTLVEQNNTFKAHFTEASCNVNHLSVKLHTVKMEDEEDENRRSGSDGNADMGTEEHETEFTRDHSSALKGTRFKMEGKQKGVSHEGESYVDSESSSRFDVESRRGLESMEEDKSEKKYFSETASTIPDTEIEELETDEDLEQPKWRQEYLSGLDDREKVLLDEYSSVLQNYKDVRKKLNDVEQKNREGFFELALQIRELKNAVASRDGEIQTLRQKGRFEDENKDANSVENESTVTESMQTSPISVVQRKDSDEKVVEATTQEGYKDSPKNMEDNVMQVKPGSQSQSRSVASVEEKIRSAIDGILEENLEFWLRFSTSFHQIRKYQTSVQDLKAELSGMREKKRSEGSGSGRHRKSVVSEARPIYSHFREIQTELTLWLENNAVLKDEVAGRYSSLCNIQDEVSKVTNVSGPTGETELSGYQAAKFQGEIVNMKLENSKVSDELKAGFDRVRQLKVEVEKIMADLEKEFMPLSLSSPRTPQAVSSRPSRPRIPLRFFLFGIKLKNKRSAKAASMFACGHPLLQKQHSFIAPPPEQAPE